MTETQETKRRGFAQPEAKILPTLVCLGNINPENRVGKIEDAKISKSGNYVTVGFEIHGKGAGKNHRFWFTFSPFWLDFNFDLKDLENKEGYPDLVYASNVCQKEGDGLAILQGICGNNENYLDLCELLANVTYDSSESATEKEAEVKAKKYCGEITKVLKNFFNSRDITIGYVLTQKTEKSGVNDEGKAVYKRTPYYDISFFYPDEETLDRYRDRAQKTADKIKAALEEMAEARAYNSSISDGSAPKKLPKIPRPFQVTFDEEDVPF